MKDEHPPCCPPQLYPQITAAQAGETSSLKGVELHLGEKKNIQAYVVSGPKSDQDIKGCILVFHDIFGYNSGRTHHMCDEIATRGNYLVVAPNFFGENIVNEPEQLVSFSFFTKASALGSRGRVQWHIVEKLLTDVVLPYIRSRTK
jgi:dienelactone hydrolase